MILQVGGGSHLKGFRPVKLDHETQKNRGENYKNLWNHHTYKVGPYQLQVGCISYNSIYLFSGC